MIKFLAIAGGGALGAIARYTMTLGVHLLFGNAFPFGTLAVNVLGSLLMGFLSILLLADSHLTEAIRGFLLIGLLGSFTTFSAFSLETLTYFESGKMAIGLLNILLNTSLCLLAIWIGVLSAKTFV